jgi:hypothetical protein
MALLVPAALLLSCGIGVADAADPTLLAVNGGFLLGNAYRCGVSTERVTCAEKVIHGLIGAAAYTSTEEAAADARFAESFVAGAYPKLLIPACNVVVTQFDKPERHHRQAGLN